MFFLAGRAPLLHCGKAPLDKGIPMDTTPPLEQRQRMTSAFKLYEDLLDAAGVPPRDQVIDLIFLQALLQAPDDTLQRVRDLLATHAQICASLLSIEQAAERLEIKPKLVRQLAKLGVLSGRRSARHGWRFTEKAIEDFAKTTDRHRHEQFPWQAGQE